MPPPIDQNKDGRISKYEQDLYDWYVRKESGNPFPGPAPWPSHEENIGIRMSDARAPNGIPNDAFYTLLAQDKANAAPRANPYQMDVASRARDAQAALMQQMQARMQGQSVAGQMGAQAMGQNAMAASAAMGGGPLAGRMAAGRMGTVGGGLMGQTAMGRMQENIGGLGGMFGVASGMRGADLQSSGDQAQAGLRQRSLDDAAKMYFSSQGASLDQARAQQALERYKLMKLLELSDKERQDRAVQQAAGGAASGIGGPV